MASVDCDYEIIAAGERAEAPDLPGALCAARQLVADYLENNPGARTSTLRKEILITHYGQYDSRATMMARQGRTL